MIKELLARNEDKTLEFKENARSLSGIVKTVIAFANTAGGTIVIGVADKTKKVVGVADALEDEERLASVISDSIAPLIVPNLEIQTYQKKELILINVPHVAGPYYLKTAGPDKGVFVRFGSTNRIADSEMLDTLRLFAKKISFDEIPYPRAKVDDLDWVTIKKVFRESEKNITPHKAQDLGMLVEHAGQVQPSYGGIILFGFNRLRNFPDAIIRCVRFLGDDKAARVLDHAEIDEYPVVALDRAIHFIEKNTMTRSEFGRIRRIDIPQYPPIAVREAIVNAIVHADYAIKGSPIMIVVFDDRIEITSPGGIPLGMTMERAMAGSSRVRNRVIARVFRELKITEQWGSGLQKMIDACVQHGLDKPKFQDLGGEFKVTLYATKLQRSSFDDSHDRFIESVKKNAGKIRTKDAAQLWGITTRNALIKLKTLVDLGILKKMGTSLKDPRGYYVLTQYP